MKHFVITVVVAVVAFVVGAAAVSENAPYEYSGSSSGPVKIMWEETDCLIGQAINHANTQLSLSGADALDLVEGNCPIKEVTIYCRVNEGTRTYDWEYKTQQLEWSKEPIDKIETLQVVKEIHK